VLDPIILFFVSYKEMEGRGGEERSRRRDTVEGRR
jgi:hypothetical protein